MAEKQKLSESDTIILSLHERWWKKMLPQLLETHKKQSCMTENQKSIEQEKAMKDYLWKAMKIQGLQ